MDDVAPATIAIERATSPIVDRAKRRILYKFVHGLGDAVQFTSVLQHLREYRRECQIDVAALVGKHSAFGGLCDRVFILNRDRIDESSYDEIHEPGWWENYSSNADSPQTKVCNFLREMCGIRPEERFLRYHIDISPIARARAAAYLRTLGCAEGPPFRAVALHYEGNTSGERKNLDHEIARLICDTIDAAGYTPIVLDWDRRSPLPDQQRIHCPTVHAGDLWGGTGTGDAEMLAALISQVALMIGVDSGPLHVAGATRTPTIGVWTLHHPIQFYDLAENVLHLVPSDHHRYTAGPEAAAYFAKHYRHRTYTHLSLELPALVESYLTGANVDSLINKRFLSALTSTAFDRHYYDEHKHAGLDYLTYGEWQIRYGRWLVDALRLAGRRVLDVGCACGSILRGLGEGGAIAQGIDVSEYMIQLGRRQWPDMTNLLFVCDAVNLHLFADRRFDAIHSSQSGEHWKPELVPFILQELARVTDPGGLFFCVLDTEELIARQGRRLETEDPTHRCIRPFEWWLTALLRAGWQVCTTEYEGALRAHPDSFLARYDWDWFVARRI